MAYETQSYRKQVDGVGELNFLAFSHLSLAFLSFLFRLCVLGWVGQWNWTLVLDKLVVVYYLYLA